MGNALIFGPENLGDDELSSDPDEPSSKKIRTDATKRRHQKKKQKQMRNRAVFLPNGDVSPYKLRSLDREVEGLVRKAEVNCGESFVLTSIYFCAS